MERRSRRPPTAGTAGDPVAALAEIRAGIASLRSAQAADDLVGQAREDVVDILDAFVEARQSAAISGVFDAHQADVERALDLARDGRYGLCEDCGEPIPAERLRYRPESTRCLECQAAFERAWRAG